MVMVIVCGHAYDGFNELVFDVAGECLAVDVDELVFGVF